MFAVLFTKRTENRESMRERRKREREKERERERY